MPPLRSSSPPARLRAAARLRIEREDLRFGPLADGRVLLEFTVHNDGEEPSRPELATISFARFGAFVPSRPVGSQIVPPIASGGSATMSATFRDLMLTAACRATTRLAFAGNFDVFVRPGVEAERHCGFVVRCVPGATNLAEFMVGHRPDAYRFDLESDAQEWPVTIIESSGKDLVWGEWRSLARTTRHLASFMPPAGAEEGGLAIGVTERSSGRRAVVEFSLSTRAEAPRCLEIG